MKKIFIAGAGGMLGEAFYIQFKNDYRLSCTDIDVNEPWLEYGDFRDLDAYRNQVKQFGPDYLFHLGALTDLEYCETHIDESYTTNTLAVENASYIANELDIPLLYISTAGIFDGKKDTYDDWDSPNPLGSYARSKFAGEMFVQQTVRRHLICRAGWMMGGGPNKDKKFIGKLMKKLKAGERELFIVNDRFGVPTYTHEFARNVRLLLESEYWGLYNMVCRGLTDRLEVANELIRVLGLKEKVKVTEVGSNFFAKEFFAPRPPSERLINRKLDLRKANVMGDWKEALKDYMDRNWAGYLD
jgi:dTDP-4-dehydrorhamnose reductase